LHVILIFAGRNSRMTVVRICSPLILLDIRWLNRCRKLTNRSNKIDRSVIVHRIDLIHTYSRSCDG
jgi:hypothetical protein